MPKIVLTVMVGLVVAQLATLPTTVYLHRALSHRALTVRAPLAFGFRVITWLTTGIKPREWVAVHRKHHAFTDTPEDPHSPAILGWLRVQLTNPALYRRSARDPETVARYAKDLPPDRWDRLVFDHAFVGLGLGITLLILMLGPVYGLIAAAVHTISYLWIGGAVNSLAHHFGRRPYQNSATNLQFLAFFTGGEGLHNNHHAAPTSARFSLHKREIDIGWWAIATFRRLGLAKVRLDQVKLVSHAAAGVERRSA
jgi:stearoyl-CoA desaturase (Delta-9 desaturase)